MPVLTRDGVRLVYDVRGAGEPPIVFIHGWTSDRTLFAAQVERFASAHRCLSVDLRGHGESDAPEQDYTIDGFADDVAAVCDEAGVGGAFLVGHSMGGAIAARVAATRPDLVRAVALLDPAVLFPEAVRGLIGQLAVAFGGENGTEALRSFFGGFFLPTTDPALVAMISERAFRTPMHVVVSAFGAIGAFDSEATLAAVRVPLLYVGAEPAIADVARLPAIVPDAIVARTAGSGHFHQLEVPEQVNAMLQRFFEIAG